MIYQLELKIYLYILLNNVFILFAVFMSFCLYVIEFLLGP